MAPPSPDLSSPTSSSDWDMTISGSEGQVVSMPSGSVVTEWGRVTNLRGLMSSLCIFSDVLSAHTIKTLHIKGSCSFIGT